MTLSLNGLLQKLTSLDQLTVGICLSPPKRGGERINKAKTGKPPWTESRKDSGKTSWRNQNELRTVRTERSIMAMSQQNITVWPRDRKRQAELLLRSEITNVLQQISLKCSFHLARLHLRKKICYDYKQLFSSFYPLIKYHSIIVKI